MIKVNTSTIVVISGLAITAGSSLTFLASISVILKRYFKDTLLTVEFCTAIIIVMMVQLSVIMAIYRQRLI